MTIYRPISDLHTELWTENAHKAVRMIDRLIPPLASDNDTVLLLAGDIGSHRRRNLYAVVVNHLCDRFRLVLDVPGNHWGYGSQWGVFTPPTERDNYLFGETYAAHGIVAATLWADFQRGNPLVEEACRVGMNDFKQIDGISIEGVKARHAAHRAFLAAQVTAGSVVMTHFAPSWQSIPAKHGTDPRNGYYASDLSELILDAHPALVVHGHIHTRSDYLIGDTRVVCNPAGYDGRDHDPLLIIEIGESSALTPSVRTC